MIMNLVKVEDFPYEIGDTVICIRQYLYDYLYPVVGGFETERAYTSIGEKFTISELDYSIDDHTLEADKYYRYVYVTTSKNYPVQFCFDTTENYFFDFFVSEAEYRKYKIDKLLK